ncbi:MAG: bifunctional enoyl-CoA hydratase/phosphate acetyltransferase [Armatimonadota bacterium]
MAYTNFDEVLAAAKSLSGNRIAVCCAHELSVMEALKLAQEGGLCTPICVGKAAEIKALAAEIGYAIADEQIVDQPNDLAAAKATVALVKSGDCSALMKGQIHTADLLRAILDKEIGLRTGKLMTHSFVLELDDRLLTVTDAAMLPYPDLKQKEQLIVNAVALVKSLAVKTPKVAILAAVESVNYDMPCTLDAAILSKMADRGQIKGCIVDGPFQMDNILSEEAAKLKGITGPVAGKADICVCPDIHVGNALVKIFAHTSGKRIAGVLMGAAAPVVLTSRADTAESKMLSIAVALLASK